MQSRKTTIKDIANAVGVSTSLVSFVMNNNGKRYRVSEGMTKKIKEAAKKLNYQPNDAARSLRSGRSRTIGVIVSDISNPFFANIARHIEDNAFKHNYTVVFGSSDESARKLENLIDVLLNKGVDGLIIVPCDGSEEIIEKLSQTSIPVVLLDRYVENQDLSRVVLNNKKASVLAVEHLIERGYRNIEMVSYDLHLSNIFEREAGYVYSMERNGLGNNVKIHKIPYLNIEESTFSAISKMSESKVTDAIIFATNTLAMAGLKSLVRRGVNVPKDIAVVGFDGSEALDLFYTSLTYVKQPIQQFGYEVIELMIKSIEDGKQMEFVTITLNPELVLGKSSVPKDKR